MPKGTTPHYQKKNSAMAEAWARRKREHNAADDNHLDAQADWRTIKLQERCLNNRLQHTVTEKNIKEAASLGFKITINEDATASFTLA
jgi:hypothetical protein